MQLPMHQEITLIYDRDVSGHHLDYLQFLVIYLENQPLDIRQQYIFAINPAARQRFENSEPKINFQYLAQSKIDEFESEKKILRRTSAELKHLEELAQRHGAKKIILMHLDAFQYELGKSHWQQSPLRFSGILFLPFRPDYEPSGSPLLWLKRELKGLRKSLQMKWMLQNKNIEEIFVLNDIIGVQVHKLKYGREFVLLPDPINPNIQNIDDVKTIKNKYKIPEDKVVYLIYGHISTRKNIPNVIRALNELSDSEQSKICLVVAGEVEKDYEVIIINEIAACAGVESVKHFCFLGPKDTDEIFSVADVVLVPYINFYSSSNILGIAAKHQKPLIASNLGLMGSLVEKYSLGKTVSPDKPNEITQAIRYYLSDKVRFIDGSLYLDTFSSDIFCKRLLHS